MENNCKSYSTLTGDQSDTTVLFNKGCIWRETLSIAGSGTSGHPFTFGAYGTGTNPIINGSAVVSSWTTESYTGNVNLNPNPKAIDSWGQAGAGFSINANVASPLAPDGTQTADGIIPSASNGTHDPTKDWPAIAGTVYTVSAYVYPGTSTWFSLQADTNTSGWGFINYHYSTFNLSNGGSVGTGQHDVTSRGISYDNVTGWYHVWITFTADTNTAHILTDLFMATGDDVTTFAGNGTSVYTYAWGVKAEAATTPTVIDNRTLYYASYTTKPNLINRDSIRLLEDTTSKNDLVNGRFWSDTGNKRVYTYDNPSGHIMENGDWYTPIDINGQNYITLQNLSVTKSNYSGILLYKANHILIDGISSNSNYVRGVDNNGAVDDLSSFITVENGTFNDNGVAGIEFHGGGGGAGQLHDITIQGNTVTSNGWQANYTIFTSGIKIWGGYGGTTLSYNSIIQNNDVSDTKAVAGPQSNLGTGVGIWVDEWGTGAVVQYNKTYNNGGSGIVAEHHSGTTILSNILYNNSIYFPTSAPQLSVSRSTSNTLVYNNTCYSGVICYGVNGAGSDRAMTGNILKNNIAYGYSSRALSATLGGENTGGGSGNVYLYNNFGPESSNFIEWGNGVYKSTYAAFDSAYGSATHSVIGDPKFSNAAGNNFTLLSTSPAIDTGVSLDTTYKLGLNPNSVWPNSVNTLDQTLNGAGWDIGAYIYTQSTAPTVSLTTPSAGVLSKLVTVSATASAAALSVISSVQFKLDGVNLGSNDTTSPYSITWDTTTATNGTHTLTAMATDNYSNTTTSTGVSVTVDNLAPVITMNGGDATLNFGQSYSDLGAAALDARQGDLTSNIVTVSHVNTSVAGTYTVTYDVSDDQGNAATQAVRTVTVKNATGNGAPVGLISQHRQNISTLLAPVIPFATSTTPTTSQNQTTNISTFVFTKNLSLHTTGADVKSLQQYLNTHGFVIATNGAGSPANETTLFGSLTYKALQKFQKSIGLPATGFFGPMTRVYIANH
jgi:hypothetical protein